MGDVLFQIDAAPFQFKVDHLRAALAAAQQQAKILKSSYEQATANVAGLEAQVKFNAKRLKDIQTLYESGANTEFREQDTQVQFETMSAQLGAARAAQQSAKLALDSEIGGVNTTVAQVQAQLENAEWELSQTTVRAPADGYVTLVTLTVGDRALQARSVMSFVVENEITIIGMFSQNGFQTIKVGAPVDIVFETFQAASITQGHRHPQGDRPGPGRRVRDPSRTTSVGGTTAFPAEISIPDEMGRDSLRLGMSGERHRLRRKGGCNRSSGLHSRLGQLLYRLPLVGC